MEKEQKNKMAFTRINYLIMLAGIALIVAGFTVMAFETAPQGFGFLGLTLGPIIVLLGFATQFIAILYKGKNTK